MQITIYNGKLIQHKSHSAHWRFSSEMWYINLRFTCLLTLLIYWQLGSSHW